MQVFQEFLLQMLVPPGVQHLTPAGVSSIKNVLISIGEQRKVVVAETPKRTRPRFVFKDRLPFVDVRTLVSPAVS